MLKLTNIKSTLMKFRILLYFFLCISVFTNAQITTSKTSVDFTLRYEKDSIYHILTFWKDKDSTIYSSVKYSVTDFNKIATYKKLNDEIPIIQQLWEKAEDSIKYNLQSFNIGYPLLYSDILTNHIHAFKNSEEWQNHVKKNGKKLEYALQKKIMLETDVYKPLAHFLKTKGYTITGIETEKHGFVTKENLQKSGFSGNEIIPMPFIVWLVLDKE